MKMSTNNSESAAAALLRACPGINVVQTAAGKVIAAATQMPVSTLLARFAAAAMTSPRGVVSRPGSLSGSSSTGATASTGMPSFLRKRSRPVMEPKWGGRIRAAQSATVGASVISSRRPISTHMPSHWAGIGRAIRAAATSPPITHSVTMHAAVAICRRVRAVTPAATIAVLSAAMNR